jgi:hypothetical protein
MGKSIIVLGFCYLIGQSMVEQDLAVCQKHILISLSLQSKRVDNIHTSVRLGLSPLNKCSLSHIHDIRTPQIS